MSAWTHAICENCWIDRMGKWEDLGVNDEKSGEPIQRLVSIQLPHRLRVNEDGYIGFPEKAVEGCCFCGRITISGIVTREDPESDALYADYHPHTDG